MSQKPSGVAEIDGGPLDNIKSVFQHIEQGLLGNPNDPAVICMHQSQHDLQAVLDSFHASSTTIPNQTQEIEIAEGPAHDGNRNEIYQKEYETKEAATLSYHQLHCAAVRLSHALVAHGMSPGDRILLLIPNGAEFAILLWTCVIMGIAYVPLDLAYLDPSKRAELRGLVEAIGPHCVVVGDEDGAASVNDAIQGTGFERLLRISLSPRGMVTTKWEIFPNLLLSGQDNEDPDKLPSASREDHSAKTHSILFTSGTSGLPKGCPLPNSSMAHMLGSQSWLLTSSNSDRALQLAHNSRGIAPQQMLSTWRVGGCVILNAGGFNVRDIVRAIREFRASFIAVTPALVHLLAAEVSMGNEDETGRKLTEKEQSVVKTIMVGGESVTKGVLMRCQELFPLAKVCVNHGMTEGVCSFMWPFFSIPISSVPFFGEICPIGKVAPGGIVRIWDAEAKALCKRNEPGELHVSAGSLIEGYMGGRSAESFYHDSLGRRWFVTGDIAMMTGEGYVYILGRAKDRIMKRKADMVMTIVPTVIEGVLERITGAQNVVIRVPDGGKGDRILSVVSHVDEETKDGVLTKITDTLGSAYQLDGIVSLKDLGLNGFPVNGTHKIIRVEVQSAVMRYILNVNGNNAGLREDVPHLSRQGK